jgi:hypothetical protein
MTVKTQMQHKTQLYQFASYKYILILNPLKLWQRLLTHM